MLVAESLGYNTRLHYGSMNYENSEFNRKMDSIYFKNQFQIDNGIPFEQQAEFDEGLKKMDSDGLKITLGGPLQTIFTGIVGLVLLVFRKEKIREQGLNILDWLAVFLGLFWLREVFNLIHSLGFTILYDEGNYFGGDEMYISKYFDLGSGTIPIVLGIIGFVVTSYIIFNILPDKFRLPIIISGFIGGVTGFVLWFYWLGPILLP